MAERWRAHPGALARPVLGELLVLAPLAAQPVVVSGVGVGVWEQLASPVAAADLTESISEAYGVSPDVVAADVSALLDQLAALGAIELVST